MYPLGLCVFCTYGPKVVREAASLLSLGAMRTPNFVGRGLVSLRDSALFLGAVGMASQVGWGGVPFPFQRKAFLFPYHLG